MARPLIDPSIFDHLKLKLEQDSKVREDLSEVVEQLENNVSYAQGVLSRVHSTPRAQYSAFLPEVEAAIGKEIETVGKLAALASQHPYYKYNGRWTRSLQDAILTMLLCTWLGGMGTEQKPGELGRLLTLEETGETFGVPVNLKDRDSFHITIEEYLMSVANMTDELSRLAINAVTLGDHALAVKISKFVRDLHNGFQLLNLKNDFLRKRVDGIKYSVKKVEDIVYDLSLRNLLPATDE